MVALRIKPIANTSTKVATPDELTDTDLETRQKDEMPTMAANIWQVQTI